MSAGCAGFIKIIYGHMLGIRARSLRTPISSLPAPPAPALPSPLSSPSLFLEHFPISKLLAGEPRPSQAMHTKCGLTWPRLGWGGREDVQTCVCAHGCVCTCVWRRRGKGKDDFWCSGGFGCLVMDAGGRAGNAGRVLGSRRRLLWVLGHSWWLWKEMQELVA